jgi:hypothetical protein
MIRRSGFELRHQAPCTPWKQVTDLANDPELVTYFAEPGQMEDKRDVRLHPAFGLKF